MYVSAFAAEQHKAGLFYPRPPPPFPPPPHTSQFLCGRRAANGMGAVDGRSSALDYAVGACNRVAAALGISSGAVSSAAA